MPNDRPCLTVENLHVSFAGDPAEVIDGVSLVIEKGRTVALVGESGCGKSVTSLAIMGLLPHPPARITQGSAIFHPPGADQPLDLLGSLPKTMSDIRGRHIAMIFQDPLSALNPVFSIGAQLTEVMTLRNKLAKREAYKRAAALLEQVGIANASDWLAHYPHELSGGMRQRVLIAMALAARPSLVIADEPTTALDVTVQRQILDLLRTCQQRFGMSLLLITHDFGVVSELADDVYVMYAGRIVEHAPRDAILAQPLHPYTQGLLQCVPTLDTDRVRLDVIPGRVPDVHSFPVGCRFHPRCALTAKGADDTCRSSSPVHGSVTGRVLTHCMKPADAPPPLTEVAPSHFVACRERG